MKTKIIATIGPASNNKAVLKEMIKEGLDIVRINFSHATYDWFIEVKKLVIEINQELKKDVKIIMDLMGPRLRIGELPKEGIKLLQDQEVIFSTTGCDINITKHDINFPGCLLIEDPFLDKDIQVGDTIFINNGLIELITTKVLEKKIHSKVVVPGMVFSRMGVNLPQTKLTTGGLTKKDVEDVNFGLEQKVDYMALSFVQEKKDIDKLRKLTNNNVKIISKIERALALKNIDEIIQSSDSIMVARGDLGTEVPIEKIPNVQKYLIKKANWYNKGSIVATQMMVSMVNQKHPTRAEVSDIATAVFDGTDAVMMSEETAIGKYPVESVKVMVKIVKEVEEYLYERRNYL